jgi:threonine synthase
MEIGCSNCGNPYPESGVAYKCAVCGSGFDFKVWPAFEPDQVETGLPGIWRYRGSFGLPADSPVVSLGEGGTPLMWVEVGGKKVALKPEYMNPTGSHKDRGVALMVSFLRARGVAEAVEDSSGNAGASFAAYAARAGIRGRVFVPDYASGPKRRQIEAYGSEVVRILGRRSDVSEAVQKAAEEGAVYASHAYLPQLLPGFATLAYELHDQLGRAPGTVIVPAGQGSLLLGIGRGFAALKAAGQIETLPRLVGVQAMACAPLWAVFRMGPAGYQWVTEGETAAEGVRVRYPIWGDAVIRAVSESGGTFVAVEEEHILPARDDLGRLGFYVEPTSAIVWEALRAVLPHAEDPIVVVLTGSGLKSSV